MADDRRYGLDDLRRYATDLGVGLGVLPVRASALASHLLWFDAAGAAPFGIATLPALLDRFESGEIDAKSEGAVISERTGTVVLDGRKGVPLLVLDRAGGLATEKARDSGVGLVRVSNVGAVGSAAVIAAEMAVGPTAALLVGPGPVWAVALPGAGGLPAVHDPSLVGRQASQAKPGKSAKPSPPEPEPLAALWAQLLAGDGGWLVAAYTVTAQESLAGFFGRLSEPFRGLVGREGVLLPEPWEVRRREARERGLAIAPSGWKALGQWAERLGVAPPEPLDGGR